MNISALLHLHQNTSQYTIGLREWIEANKVIHLMKLIQFYLELQDKYIVLCFLSDKIQLGKSRANSGG